MQRQNRYKNRFKSVGSSSLAPGQSSQLQPQAQGSLAPGQSSQAQASLASRQSSQLQPQAQGSSSSSYRDSIPSSSSDGVSSQLVIPSASNGSKPTKHKDDEDDHDWLVDVIDEHQLTRKMRLKLRNVHNLDNLRIIVESDEYGTPIGKAGSLIAGVLGQLVTNPLYFPIGFVKWPDMPDSYLDRVFNEIIMPRFLFEVDREKAKEWFNSNLNKKWRDNRCTLWNNAQDPVLSKEEMIRKCPEGIPVDQWALVVNYCMKNKTKLLCEKNKLARQKQIPLTGGAKSLARRRAEMRAKGKDVDRGQMWNETHKRKDGTYVTEEARKVGVSEYLKFRKLSSEAEPKCGQRNSGLFLIVKLLGM